MVGTGLGAENGILIKGGESLEKAYKLTMVVFDKTGTLTRGEPGVTDVIPAQGFSQDKILSIAVSIEATSEHPLAQAILERGRREQVLPGHTEQFEALSGLGAKAILRGQPCLLGNLQLMEKEGVQMNGLDREAERLAGEGKSCVFVAEGDQAIGVIGLADVPRPSAKEAVSTLKDMGLKVAMITGDNASTAITNRDCAWY